MRNSLGLLHPGFTTGVSITEVVCFQFHELLFMDDSKHKVMCMQKYIEDGNVHTKILCETHNQELTLCCKVCYQMKCVSCQSDDNCRGPSKLSL